MTNAYPTSDIVRTRRAADIPRPPAHAGSGNPTIGRPGTSATRRLVPRLTSLPPASQVDRFIPSRSALDLDIAHYNLVKENASSADLDLASEVASPSKVRRDRTRSEFPLSAIARDLVSRSKALASDA